jgi:hypothetical protein
MKPTLFRSASADSAPMFGSTSLTRQPKSSLWKTSTDSDDDEDWEPNDGYCNDDDDDDDVDVSPQQNQTGRHAESHSLDQLDSELSTQLSSTLKSNSAFNLKSLTGSLLQKNQPSAMSTLKNSSSMDSSQLSNKIGNNSFMRPMTPTFGSTTPTSVATNPFLRPKLQKSASNPGSLSLSGEPKHSNWLDDDEDRDDNGDIWGLSKQIQSSSSSSKSRSSAGTPFNNYHSNSNNSGKSSSAYNPFLSNTPSKFAMSRARAISGGLCSSFIGSGGLPPEKSFEEIGNGRIMNSGSNWEYSPQRFFAPSVSSMCMLIFNERRLVRLSLI